MRLFLLSWKRLIGLSLNYYLKLSNFLVLVYLRLEQLTSLRGLRIYTSCCLFLSILPRFLFLNLLKFLVFTDLIIVHDVVIVLGHIEYVECLFHYSPKSLLSKVITTLVVLGTHGYEQLIL